jgi:hypothetical protein
LFLAHQASPDSGAFLLAPVVKKSASGQFWANRLLGAAQPGAFSAQVKLTRNDE